MLVKRKPKSGPSFLVLSKARLAKDFDQYIIDGNVEATVSAIFDDDEKTGLCQLAYEGDIVLSCLGDATDPMAYRANVVEPKKNGVELPGVLPGHGILPGVLKRTSVPINIIMLCCKSDLIQSFLTDNDWKPTKEFLISGMTIQQLRAKKRAQRKHMAKAKS